MKILCITDIHDNGGALERILEKESGADILILGGDLTTFKTPIDAALILDIASRYPARLLAVAGNCDSPEIDKLLVDRGISLHGRGVEAFGAGFFGVSAMPPWMGNMYEFTEKEIDGFLGSGYSTVRDIRPLVMVSHAPPRDCSLDLVRSGQHAGSSSVRSWIEQAAPDLVFTGHIHEARGKEMIGNSLVINCGVGAEGCYSVATIDEKTTARVDRV